MQIAHHLSELWKKNKKGVLFMKHRVHWLLVRQRVDFKICLLVTTRHQRSRHNFLL